VVKGCCALLCCHGLWSREAMAEVVEISAREKEERDARL
jgi:hypothetical protein